MLGLQFTNAHERRGKRTQRHALHVGNEKIPEEMKRENDEMLSQQVKAGYGT
jgi:hypothetical protein